MDPDLLNNLYLVGGLLAAIFVIVWRLTSASQKAVVQSIDYLQLQITGLKGDTQEIKDRLGKVESRLDNVEARLGKVEHSLDNVEARLGKVESRLDNVEARLGKVEHGLDNVEVRLGKVEHSLEHGLTTVDNRVRHLQMDMVVAKDRLHSDRLRVRLVCGRPSRVVRPESSRGQGVTRFPQPPLAGGTGKPGTPVCT